ncbi:hypothetical protein [Rhodanobacter lindaniclasticus]|uniref:hypothetical protein n=1 Tax=Rhodanobacter lindaniclasticus TaxID=75310 RepID=UPI001445D3AC|nr:hypothetical protein [Rhodanobacter lindaniclasticus]
MKLKNEESAERRRDNRKHEQEAIDSRDHEKQRQAAARNTAPKARRPRKSGGS